MKNHKPLHLFSYITILLTAVLMGLIVYWSFWPSDFITIENPMAVQVDKESYHPGDRITYTVSYCKKGKLPGDVIRALVDGTRITYTTVYSDLPEGCHTINVSDLVIPDYVNIGKTYYLETTMVYKVNPLRNFNIYWKSVDFKIIK